MKLAVSGYVSAEAGSVASANALLLRSLLDNGHEVDFFSKPSFVDPRPCVGEHGRFRFIGTDNVGPDRFRAKVERVPALGFMACRWDCATYERLLLKMMRQEHNSRRYDLCLWLGDYAPGRVCDLPTISFAQGPPGTDARSVLRRRAEIRRLAVSRNALRWELLARLRLSRLGIPQMQHSDHLIVGSSVSRDRLTTSYNIPRDRISTLPYPIDLELFRPSTADHRSPITDHRLSPSALRALWLGRIVPRKRLDLFLDSAALAIRNGLDLKLTIVGSIGFVSGYEKLIKRFPFPERLTWIRSLPRAEVPDLLRNHDVLVQPSDEENFGSSVAEAQACGLPVIVGQTNGNADYLCARDIHLSDDRPETFAAALGEMAARKSEGRWGDVRESRQHAEQKFHLPVVTRQLMKIIEQVCAGQARHRCVPT